ncbi:MAG: hypothetical protein HY924_06895 [Elusimicrobia bacterium]|nr:hypothetical protein [Elusimicrobiota bacterium]
MRPTRPVCAALILAWAALEMPPQATAAAVLIRVAPRSAPIVVQAVPFLLRNGLPGENGPASFSALPVLPRVGSVPTLSPAPTLTAAPAPSLPTDPDLSGPATLKDLLAEPESFSLSAQALDRMETDGAREAGTRLMDRVLGTRSPEAAPVDAALAARPEADIAPGASSPGLQRPDRAPRQGRGSGRAAVLMTGAVAGASLVGHAAAAYGALPVSPIVLAGAAAVLLLTALFTLIPLADVAQQEKDARRQAAIVRVMNMVGLSAVALLSAALTLGAYWNLAAAAAVLFLLYVTVLSPSLNV